MKILVIDDDKAMLANIGRMLGGSEHQVTLMSDAASELQDTEAQDFDAVITDILMPKLDGIDVIKSLRQDHPGLWIVAMSGGGELPAVCSLKLSEAFGADRILYKPFRKPGLLQALERN